jgi:ornithine cyclodeaminase
MLDNSLTILKGHEVESLLAGRELEIIEAVRGAYLTHAAGQSSLPHSTFLRFPDDEKNRIIALPAYLGDDFGVAGIKWVSSFPGNLAVGLNRASAVIVLNNSRTGQPEAILEGSIISAKRTAASAALAARYLHTQAENTTVGIVGCGLISSEIIRFLHAMRPALSRFMVYDLSAERAENFRLQLRAISGELEIEVVSEVRQILENCTLIALATTATKPHLYDLSACAPETTILHISLRDLAPELILAADNVVDDVDHVCRAQTSIHLAEQLSGRRGFIRCTLADIMANRSTARAASKRITIFSPFGLGVLDLAVSKLVRELGVAQQCGTTMESFLPTAGW